MTDRKDDHWLKRGSQEAGEIQAYYDDLADEYDAQLEAWNYRAPAEAARMLQPLAAPQAAVFDAGCGTGLTGAALRAAGFSGPIDGGDLSPRSVELARARGIYRSVRVMNFQELPLDVAENSYDAAICIGVMTYIPDAEAFLRDLCRITREGGIVVFSHRDDLFRAQGFGALLDRIAGDGLWSKISLSEPRAYLPDNPDFAEDIRVVFGACRVTGRSPA